MDCEEVRVGMLNKLHFEMIKLYNGDAKRIQHFCKVHSYAKLIAEMENVDKDTLFIIETAAFTHDIGIHLCEEKYGDCNGKLQEKKDLHLHKSCLKVLIFRRMCQRECNTLSVVIIHITI